MNILDVINWEREGEDCIPICRIGMELGSSNEVFSFDC